MLQDPCSLSSVSSDPHFVVRSAPQKSTPVVRGAVVVVVEEIEGMFTPTDVLLHIKILWKHATDCILDVPITNLDAPFGSSQSVLLPPTLSVTQNNNRCYTFPSA